jgi:uncharacterized protein
MTFVVPSNFRQLPPVWEMSQPFNIDGNGVVAYDSDPAAWARNHILALLLTAPGERVMRPTYGVGIFRYVWENQDALTQQQLINQANQGLAFWEPNINIQQVDFLPAADFSGVVNMSIAFTLGASPTIQTVTFSLGGTGIEITAGI